MRIVSTSPETARLARGAARSGRLASAELPRPSRWWLGWFNAYGRRHIRKHFHALRLCGPAPRGADSKVPIVVYLNHASWWDPLVCLELKNRFFAERAGYAPIEAAMLDRYRFFRKLGFFGVEQNNARSGFQFLKVAEQVLRAPDTVLFITPQSRFADVRQRPVKFASGIGHLAARCERAYFVPLALEYVFWQERFPEILVRFGDPVDTRIARAGGAHEWTALLEARLSETQDALAVAAQEREPLSFETLLGGRAGAAAVYDLWRALRAKATGETFQPEHGAYVS